MVVVTGGGGGGIVGKNGEKGGEKPRGYNK